MADLVHMRARRRFWLTPKRRPVAGETFHVSPGLAERLARRGDASPELEAKPRRRRKQVSE